MDGWRAKLARAQQHLYTLHTEIQGFLGLNPYQLVPEFNPEHTMKLWRVRVTGQTDPDWPLLIGECLHNLHASLDQMIWQLVMPPIGTGTKQPRRVGFPIAEDSSWWTSNGIKKLDGAPKGVLAFVEPLQPFKRRNLAIANVARDRRYWSDPLYSLGQLSNWDKHRLPHLTGSTIKSMGWFTSILGPTRYPGVHVGPFEDKAIVMWVPLESGEEDVNMDPSFTFDVAFENEWPGMGRPVIETLTALTRFVSNTLPPLERFCWRVH